MNKWKTGTIKVKKSRKQEASKKQAKSKQKAPDACSRCRIHAG
jgi:hypothetical protein